MKKTEIVRVRIDSPTYSACVQHCQNTGESLSTVLRKSLKAVIKKEVDTCEAVLRESDASHGPDQTRPEDLAKILIAHLFVIDGPLEWKDADQAP
jgi:antitoxin component of RelBE/YafQ-DinJ toxin-antitoxin module